MDGQLDQLIGESPAFLQVLEEVSAIAILNKPVLVVGERGTGKELIAARIHHLSSRWDAAYLQMNCAAITDTLLESELFGHEAGSFTGAARRHLGRFERADGGTLFLDELATTSVRVQEKVLRLIEYGQFERVGGNQTITVDVRIVAATNTDLAALAAEGEFRVDLLDRLAFDVITLPPLRERGEDIMLLASYFALNMTKELSRESFAGFSESAANILTDYDWPGNVRELKNVVERAVYQHEPDEPIVHIVLDPFDSPYRPVNQHVSGKKPTVGQGEAQIEPTGEDAKPGRHGAAETNSRHSSGLDEFPIDLKETVQDIEVQIIQSALSHARFNQRVAASNLGLSYDQLRGRLRKYDSRLSNEAEEAVPTEDSVQDPE